MAGKGKIKTVAIKLVSTAGTGFFYATTKNPRNVPAKLALKKVHCALGGKFVISIVLTACLLVMVQYDPVVRKHVLFTESKMK